MKLSTHTYPKDILQNKKYRIDIWQAPKEIRDQAIVKCALDPLYFINVFGWTYNPRLDKPHLPFVTYAFQDTFITEIVKCIENDEDNITEKSRDMGFSWMLVALQVWGFLFKGWSSLYGSYKEDYVDKQGNMDAHFERVRYLLERLPKWLKPSDLFDKYMNISSKTLSAEISGDSGQNFGTGGRRKFVILDEYALWQFAEKAFRKTRDVTNCRIFGGTPEGRFNLYGKIMTGHKDYQHLKIKKFRLHWSDHPLKDLNWYNNEKENRTKLDLAKEVDISYEDSVTGAVYKDFTTLCKFGKYEFNPQLPLYTSWDFGRDTTAIIWFQKDFKNDALYIIDAYQNSNKLIDFYVAFVLGYEMPNCQYNEDEIEMIKKHKHWTHKYANHFGDPYNALNKSVVTNDSIASTLKGHGIHLQINRNSTVEQRINTTILAMRRMNIDDSLFDFLQAIAQARYPQVSEGAQPTTEKTKPVHDETSHFRTALEYFCDNEPKSIRRQTSQTSIPTYW